jgi:FMN reductase
MRAVRVPCLAVTNPSVVALVGNPRPGSRTAGIAELAATGIAARLDAATATIDLAVPDLDREAARALVVGARVVVVASPTYKAAYTGLLKAFLDELPSAALAGVVAVPLLTMGDAKHTLAADVHLRPVLLELGATCPTSAIVVVGEAQDAPAATVDDWLRTAGPVIDALA